ncbi:hypothetical protein ANTPLA_LOCUS4145 [Anthophora plagiata]
MNTVSELYDSKEENNLDEIARILPRRNHKRDKIREEAGWLARVDASDWQPGKRASSGGFGNEWVLCYVELFIGCRPTMFHNNLERDETAASRPRAAGSCGLVRWFT